MHRTEVLVVVMPRDRTGVSAPRAMDLLVRVYGRVPHGVPVSMNERAAPMRLDRRLAAVEASADFESFFRSERPRLFGSMLLITGSTHEADELVQEAFFKVWERWDRVGVMENPTGYLYRTALNAQRSAYRRAIRAAKRTLSPPPSPDPLAAVAARDEVLRALAAMTPRQRTAVVLTELHGYDTSEAARAMGIRPGTVRVLVSKGRAALRARTEPNDA